MDKKKLEEMVKAKARENKVTCGELYQLSIEQGVSLEELGKIVDGLKIKISQCQLGCF